MKINLEFKQINLKENTSIKIGPVVKYLEIKDKEELIEVNKFAKSKKLKIHVLGDGTNSYFDASKSRLEKKYLFIKLNLENENKSSSGIKIIGKEEVENFVFVESLANTNWHELVMFTIKNNLWGLENLSLIPGTVGAAPVQNIGAYGTELKNTFVSCEVFDTVKNKFLILENKDCKFANRDSVFKKNKNRYIILNVTFKLSKIRNPILNYKPLSTLSPETATLTEISDLVIKTRKEKLPDYNVFPNSGSFIKNPKVNSKQLKDLQKKFPDLVFFTEEEKNKKVYKIPVAWFIEHVIKIKGVLVGNFGTAKTHSLVFVNYEGHGNAKELNNYVKLISKKLKKETGLEIEQEVNFVS